MTHAFKPGTRLKATPLEEQHSLRSCHDMMCTWKCPHCDDFSRDFFVEHRIVEVLSRYIGAAASGFYCACILEDVILYAHSIATLISLCARSPTCVHCLPELCIGLYI